MVRRFNTNTMKSLSDHLQNIEEYVRDLGKHPKHKMLDEFYQRVNTDLVSRGYKPWSKKRLAIKIAHLNEMDMAFLLKKVQQSMYPAKVFFGSLKPREQVVNTLKSFNK
jgi:hypothetical protein